MEYNKNDDVDPKLLSPPLLDCFFFGIFLKVRLLERKLYVAFLI